MRSIKLNQKDAMEGDKNPSNWLKEGGAHIGVFKTAKEVISSKKKTVGIEFTFETIGGLKANYLSIWIEDAEGKPLHGHKQIQAIMTCMGAREINAEEALILEWDNDAKEELHVPATIYPELMNKPIGVVFQEILYSKSDGDDGEKLEMVGFFSAENRKTASELWKKQEAQSIDKMVERLTVKDERVKKAGVASKEDFEKTEGYAVEDDEPVDAEFNDEIPFD